MDRDESDILYEGKNVKVIFARKFESLAAFMHVHDMMPPIGCVDRVVMNFSNISRVETPELDHFLTELTADPLFDGVEIAIVGLRGGRIAAVPFPDKECISSDVIDIPGAKSDFQKTSPLLRVMDKGGTRQ